MATSTKDAQAGQRPLRLMVRRDGEVLLIGSIERQDPDDPQRSFPPEFDFSYEDLLKLGAKHDGATLSIKLVNAEASYEVIESLRNGVRARLVDSRLHKTPPLDEARAAEVAARIRRERIQALQDEVAAAGGSITAGVAEKILVARGTISSKEG